ncbi:MAG: SIMPL domain-containing protein [Flavobacteriaceae bacterium]|jgi:hypothetical protein|nr:SIMPL domain-containing protein [Flavobacteriaceae bacterium]
MKHPILISTIVASVGIVLAAFFLGSAFKNRNQNSSISVTGLGTKDFVSDLIVWNGIFSKKSVELKEAYADLEKDRVKIKEYLLSKGFAEKEIVFSSVDIDKQYDYISYDGGGSHRIFTGYQLTQTVTIESKDVQKVENLSRQITELINSGVELYSRTPSYYYTKLADLKIQMIADATKDAKKRAEEIANNAGGKLGKLKKANLGVFQITAQNSADEDYSWGGTFNTSSKNKTANITIRLDYDVK